MGFLRRNIEEIRGDSVLRAYGVFLALTHVLTYLAWSRSAADLVSILTSEPVCWPFWGSCGDYRFLTADGVFWFLRAYLALSVISLVLFLVRRWATAAWWFFLVLNLLKLAVVLQDFQLRMNQHYMAGVACMAFLLIPRKRTFLKILIASFYFWAGLLKLDREWLSGAALYRPLWLISGTWIPVACAYVVVLEILLVWGLFARRSWIFWMTFAQLAVFHVFSWNVVGFFYPTLMFCLIAVYPMDRLAADGEAGLSFGSLTPLGYAVLGVFSLAQLAPHAMPGDTALTGEGRFYGVHMFDALVRCEAYAVLKGGSGDGHKRGLYREMPARIHCDPIVFWNRSRSLCRSKERGVVFDDFDLIVKARRSTQDVLMPVIDLKNYCASSPAYRVWRHNEWIRTE